MGFTESSLFLSFEELVGGWVYEGQDQKHLVRSRKRRVQGPVPTQEGKTDGCLMISPPGQGFRLRVPEWHFRLPEGTVLASLGKL